MSKMARFLPLAVLLLPAALAASSKYILSGLSPEVSKKAPQGYAVEGQTYHFRDARLDVRVTPLGPGEREAFFSSRGLTDPFRGLPADLNYIFFKVRIENLQKADTVEFSPGSSMFGNSNSVDEIAMYQLLYKEQDGDARLAAAGKGFFMRSLHLPPGQWIERLMAFQYDDPYKTKKIILVMSSILLGRDGLDLEFPFAATYVKEKQP